MRWVSQCIRAWQKAFRGQARSTGDQLRFGGSRRVRGHLAPVEETPAAVASHGSLLAACGVPGGERFRLPSHRCRSELARECIGSVNASVPGRNAFRGQARSYRRSIALRGSRRVRGHLAPVEEGPAAVASMDRYRPPAGVPGVNGSGCRHRCRSALASECIGSVNASVPGRNAFRGQARSYRRSISLSGSWRVRGHLASWMGACCSGKHGSLSAAYGGGGG